MQGYEIQAVTVLPPLSGGHLFNSPEFTALQTGCYVRYVLRYGERVLARIWFVLEGRTAVSGSGATFGSVDMAAGVSSAEVAYFLREVLSRLYAAGIRQIEVRHYPDYYFSRIDWPDLFADLGFAEAVREVDQVLAVQAGPFGEVIRYNEQKKLRQCREAGFEFRHLSVRELEKVYRLVVATRARKGYPVSMQLAALRQSFEAMPGHYRLFGVFDDSRLIAAAVSVRLTRKVLYNFYHADELAYRTRSPLVMLVEGIYGYCRQHGIDWLDLGISSQGGELNRGLFTFKKNLGCQATDKITYRLTYDES